ncbi:MAG TPA: APC family permease [Acidimicrobiales bacterium]|nr:APC family permease [Acidimicrobiales bacterium]
MYSTLKRILIGPPIASSEEHHQRLIKIIALAVFASDAISSTAYATEEILLVLIAAGGEAAFDDLVPISIVVVILLAIVVTSYRQTVYAYPSGGGSYIVSRENLGETPSLVAGSSLLVDYVLTVAVSVAGGVAAITSAFATLRPYRVEICIGFIVLMTVANLRGVKESGRLFAGPTYIYVFALLTLIGYGLWQVYVNGLGPIPGQEEALNHLTDNGATVTGITVFILMRAFSSGAVALSGVEAISNGVPAFRRPEPRNAAITLVWMGTILGGCFFGVSVLANHLRPVPQDNGETVLSIMGKAVFGNGTFLYYILQFSTFAILILAANTAYADFPRLSSIIARDGFLPRQLANRGDRLVFSNGIIVLAGLASVLIIIFHGEISALIPLYAVGVFTGFTMSQAGMVVHHWRLREPHWQTGMAINAIGAATTGVVLGVVVISKFTIGAWIPAALIPIIVIGLKSIGRHYKRVREAVVVPDDYKARRHTHVAVVLVGSVNKGVLNALSYARSLAPDRLVAVSVVGDPAEQEELTKAWDEHNVPVELHTIYSPYRELTRPILTYLDELDRESPDDIITVIIPEFVTSWTTQFLHNQTALALKARLLYRPNTVVTSVPVLVD